MRSPRHALNYFITTACLFTCLSLDISFYKTRQSHTLAMWIVTHSHGEILSSGEISTDTNATLI